MEQQNKGLNPYRLLQIRDGKEVLGLKRVCTEPEFLKGCATVPALLSL